MALGDCFTKTVVFVRTTEPERRLSGAGFIAAVPANKPGWDHAFVVTVGMS
jgi:hypothetical protein